MDQIEKKIKDDLWVLNTMEVRKIAYIYTLNDNCHLISYHFQRWYAEQVQMLCTWLTDRLDRTLHHYQCTCLVYIVKVGAKKGGLNNSHNLYHLRF